MEQNQRRVRRPLTPTERRKRRRRRRLRLLRNWVLFLSACAGAVALLTTGALRLLPKAHALIAESEAFVASSYVDSGYTLDPTDPRLVLVNGNLPLEETPSPTLAVADDATGEQLETEAASAYRTMAKAAQAQGVTLTLVEGYRDADASKKQAQSSRTDAESAGSAAERGEHATGYGADILSDECSEKTAAFAKSRAYEWLTAYAAEYGFVERWPEDRQAATGVEASPWHWRYVGRENALALRASGLSLEEFLALGQARCS